mgnify:FL=1
MKKLFTLNTLLFVMFFLTDSQAQISEKFNTRSLAPSLPDVRPYLEAQCWHFEDMDINQNGLSAFEGDGTIVSGPASSSSQITGFFTPLLDIPGSMDLYFKYKFNGNISQRSWFKLYLTDYNNVIVQLLDSVEVTGSNNNTVYIYHKTLSALPSGVYKLYWNYQGINSDISAGVDEFYESVPTYYNTSCNREPGAEDDWVTGNNDFTANGNVLLNDFDPDHESIRAELVSPSADGTVTLDQSGNFTFTPNAGFKGKLTSFLYRVMDAGMPPLYSNTAKATIDFSVASTLPVRFVSVSARTVNYEAVQINWVTESQVNNKQFEIQRSVEGGSNFKTIGLLFSVDEDNGSLKSYHFRDDLKGITVKKLFYRIKQVDIDGKFSYSKIVTADLNASVSAIIARISPNPASGNFNIGLEGKSKLMSLRIVDIWGRQIYKKSVAGLNNTTLTLNTHVAGMDRPGMYMVEMFYDDGSRIVRKILKK